jgi:hypothetical protein
MTIIGNDIRKINNQIQKKAPDYLESGCLVVSLDDFHAKKAAIPLKTRIINKRDKALEWLSNYQCNCIVIVLTHYASLTSKKYPHCERNINSQNRLRADHTIYSMCIIKMANVGHYNQNSVFEESLDFGVLVVTTPRRCFHVVTISRINDNAN